MQKIDNKCGNFRCRNCTFKGSFGTTLVLLKKWTKLCFLLKQEFQCANPTPNKESPPTDFIRNAPLSPEARALEIQMVALSRWHKLWSLVLHRRRRVVTGGSRLFPCPTSGFSLGMGVICWTWLVRQHTCSCVFTSLALECSVRYWGNGLGKNGAFQDQRINTLMGGGSRAGSRRATLEIVQEEMLRDRRLAPVSSRKIIAVLPIFRHPHSGSGLSFVPPWPTKVNLNLLNDRDSVVWGPGALPLRIQPWLKNRKIMTGHLQLTLRWSKVAFPADIQQTDHWFGIQDQVQCLVQGEPQHEQCQIIFVSFSCEKKMMYLKIEDPGKLFVEGGNHAHDLPWLVTWLRQHCLFHSTFFMEGNLRELRSIVRRRAN